MLTVVGDPSSDPEVASSVLDFVKIYIPNYLNVIFHDSIQPLLPDLLDLSIRCLVSAEILPKRAAAEFWVGDVPFLRFPCYLTKEIGKNDYCLSISYT